MAIRFTCRCGKPLKAREESAGKRTKCPQCGDPVGIPSLEPTHRGVKAIPAASSAHRVQPPPKPREHDILAEPSTSNAPAAPQSRVGTRRHSSHAKRDPSARKPLSSRDEASEHIEIRQRRQPKWIRLCGPRGRRTGMTEIGSHDPTISFIGFVVVSTAASAVIIRLLPLAIQHGWFNWPNGPLVIAACFALLAAIGYFCSCTGQILKNAIQGKQENYTFEVRLEDAITSFCAWLALLVAGPLLPAAIALDYWIRCGTPTPFDWLVLACLTMVAAGYWASLLISVNATRGIQALDPRRVLAIFEQLGHVGMKGMVQMLLMLVAFLKLVTVSAAWIHNDDVGGYLMLGIGYVVGPMMLIGILRRFGEEYRQRAIRRPHATPSVPRTNSLPIQ